MKRWTYGYVTRFCFHRRADAFACQSLGCTLYALAYGRSPFETMQTTEQGGSIAMAVLNAQYKHLNTSKYSQGLRDLIDSMLKVDPKDRPDIHEVSQPTRAYRCEFNPTTQVIIMTDRLLATSSR